MFTRRRRLLALLATAMLIVSAGTALAAGTNVTIKAKGEYAKLHRTACHKTKTFRFFHRASTIEFRGFLTPAPAGHFPVRVKIERCVNGRFRDVSTLSIIGKKLTGKYKGYTSARPLAPRSHRRRAVLYYRARAYAGGAVSEKTYFAVTN
ncbi:MAG: hypothetical protein NVS3B18_05440 [Candidatus Dormibacteria bacterium]